MPHSILDENILESGYGVESKPLLQLETFEITTTWRKKLRKIWEGIRPSILTPTSPIQEMQPLRRTAYLDGLRGFAALIVYCGHHQLWARDVIGAGAILENSWGYENRWYFACLPGIRLFFSGGHLAVTIFFVISGYVLSAKPLSYIQSAEYLKLQDNIGSALFRRWLRLYIPVICTTFIYMTSWHLFGIWTASPEHKKTYAEELWNYYIEFKNFSFVFRGSGNDWLTYNFHVWSIPVEFRGSIIIYTVLAAFSRCTVSARLWCTVGLIFYFMYITDGAHYAMFLTGMILCDLDLLSLKGNLPNFFHIFSPHKKVICYTLFIIGIYLGGVPSFKQEYEILQESPGWRWLSVFKPQAVFDYKWFYLYWASLFMVFTIPRISTLKRFFEWRFCQYLGKISFAFYLVHGPVLWILGDRLYVAAGWSREVHGGALPGWINLFPLSKAGPLGLELSFLLPHIIILPVTLWLAEIVTRYIDEPSVRFSQWLYRLTQSTP
ncbi:O-acetyltransferase PaAT-1 [Erysiphe necator]|uniref:Putative acyltransferase n=1 Tax=Uncinula necator TaxID=52586 RepID=A0A0B1P3E7_UNCNE|nr:O-acetyltransferase PaAT-1 [Erysiphe necator]KHJ31199.1 putative acyltransferase [Erysiphe necator]